MSDAAVAEVPVVTPAAPAPVVVPDGHYLTTTGEFGAKFDLEYPVAMGVLKFLESRGLVSIAERRRSASGKGKPSIVYLVPKKVNLDL